MAFAVSSGGNGPSPSSFSTLSALAPPFTVDRPRRNPNDSNFSGSIRHFTTKDSPHGSNDPTPATFLDSVFKFDTFYHHYGPVGDAGFDSDDYQWNVPYDEGYFSSWEQLKGKGVGGSIMAPSWVEEGGVGSKSLSWMEPSPSRFTPNYAGVIGQDVVSSETLLPCKNSWHVNHLDAFVRKPHLHSECNKWLDDKTSIQIQGRPKVSIKRSSASDLSLSVGNHLFPSSSGPFSSVELCGSYSYEGLIPYTGSGQSNQVACQKATYCSSSQVPFPAKIDTSISMYSNTQENPYMHGEHVDGFNRNYQQRPDTFSMRTGLNVSRKVEIKPYIAGGGKKDNVMDKTEVVAAPSKDNFDTEGLEKSLNITPLGTTNLIVQTTSETNDSSQIYSEPFDQLNLCEDSPCWKGASFSKNSPFHVDNIPHIDSCMKDKKLENEHQKPDGLIIVADSVKKSDFSDASEMENGVCLVKDAHHSLAKATKSSSPSRPCEITILSKDSSGTSAFNVSCGSINANSNALSDHPQENSFNSGVISRSQTLDPFLHVYNFDKVTKESQTSCSKEGSEGSADPHFLVRSLYDLSSFLCGYSYDATILKKGDYELLLATINNLEACASKSVEQRAYQANASYLHSRKPSSSTEVQMQKTKANSVSRVSTLQSKQTSNSPANTKSLLSTMNNNGVLDGSSDFRSAMTKEIEKSMKKIFSVEKKNFETNLYKMRWIETEAALCSANCELILTRNKDLAESSAEQPSIESQLSISEKECRREMNVAANHVRDVAENNGLVPDGCVVSPHDTTDLARDSTQTFVFGKSEAVDSSSVDDVFASVMARYGILKDRIANVESQPLKDQHEVPETKHRVVSSQEVKHTIPAKLQESEPTVRTQFQTPLFASTSTNKSRLLYSCDSEDANPKPSSGYNVQFIGSNYSKRICFDDRHYADDIELHANALVGQEPLREFPAEYGNSFFQPYEFKDRCGGGGR